MEYNPPVSRLFTKSEARNADEKEDYNQRKWVGHKMTRSLSYEEPGRAMKPVECLARLRLSNNAVFENNKQKMNIRKTITLPVITQEHSGSENSLEYVETNPDREKKYLVDQEKGRERKWKIMRRVKSDSFVSSQTRDHISQEKDDSSEQISILKRRSNDYEKAKRSRPFVALKQSQISTDLDLQNVSICGILSENIQSNKEEELATKTKECLVEDHERYQI